MNTIAYTTNGIHKEARPERQGLMLNGRYQLQHELGHGGMGTVYLAQDTYLEREVAVKLLDGHSLGTAGRGQLLHEARAA
ncbi:MAG: hypothetical protein KC433_02705, partial [Anaerolineales bacterium]|nr:hypothetical protein [Anaerolineales bacterium]